MDIRQILRETVMGPALAYRHLDPLHIGILRKVAGGKFDADTQVSGKVEEVLNDLIQFGLVTDYDYTITQEGMKALEYADKLGGSMDRRQAAQRKPNMSQDVSDTPDYFEID